MAMIKLHKYNLWPKKYGISILKEYQLFSFLFKKQKKKENIGLELVVLHLKTDLEWHCGFVWFYGISTIVGYLMPNSLYTYILNIYDLVWLGFMAYQPL